MRNFYVGCIFSLLLPSIVWAQGFGNDWIQATQPYYKVQVAKEGLFKISYEQLATHPSGDFLIPSRLQLWYRGTQQTIAVHSAGDTLQKGDYIFFYGKKNDGWQDSLLYYPTTDLFNRYAGLYSDTSAYFLTASPNLTSKQADTLKGNISSTPSSALEVSYLKSFYDEYFQMAWDGVDPSQTYSVPGEGWCSYGSENLTHTVPMANYIPGSEVTIELLLIGRDKHGFSPSIYISDNNSPTSLFLGKTIDSVNFPFGASKVSYTLQTDLSPYLNNGNLTLYVDHTNKGSVSFGYVRVLFSQVANFAGIEKQPFQVLSSGSLKVDQIAQNHIFASLDNTGLSHLVQDSIKGNTAYLPEVTGISSLFYATFIDTVATFHPVSFHDFVPTDSTYLILTHPTLLSSVNQYATYRASPSGGGYDVMIAQSPQIMDQFGYGEHHPMGIRRFLNYLKHQNPASPDHFFIIGQGIQLDNPNLNRVNPTVPPLFLDLIPTGGVPGGDYAFSIHLDGDPASNSMGHTKLFSSTIPTGRLQAKTNQVVLNYLAKVQQHESLPLEDAAWRRNILHLSGGYTVGESNEYNTQQANTIRRDMDGFASLAQLPYFGANVSTISRSTAQTSELIDISSEVNNGVSLINFLGHSGRFITDIFIGLASDPSMGYANKGKYPMLFLNGCRMGDIFIDQSLETTEKSVILDWIQTKDTGAILGLVNAGTSFVGSLNQYIQNHYISSFLDSVNISRSVGEQVIAAQKRFVSIYAMSDPYNTSMIGSYSLHGDPAVKIFPNPKADYTPQCEKVGLHALTNKKITTQTDSFDIAIPLLNRGIYTKQSFTIAVKRYFANYTQSVQYSPQTFLPIRENDTVYFRIRGALPIANGQNTFEIVIDPGNLVPELNESNNTCSYTAYIPGVTLLCVHPQEFSIVHNQPVTFAAQSSTISVNQRSFYMELDTTYLFNSPFKKSMSTQAFDLPMWSFSLLPDTSLNDSIVYYWRTRYVQPQGIEDTAFSYSSFLYVKDSPEGWSQSRYPQFFKDDAEGIVLDSTSGRWLFSKTSATIGAKALGKQAYNSNLNTSMSYKGHLLVHDNKCYFNNDALYILTISSLNLNVKSTSLGNNPYFQCDAYGSPLVTAVPGLAGSASQRDSLYKILDQEIQDGDYVLIMNIGNVGFSEYEAPLRDLLRTKFGATRIDSLKDGEPYLLLAVKGHGRIREKYSTAADPLQDSLQLDTIISNLGYAGKISSTLIGPATQWGSFLRKYQKLPGDSIRFDIAGVDIAGNETIVVPDPKENNIALQTLINAQQYPYLRLHAYVQTQTSIAPQLLTWQVIMQKSAEGALIFDDSSSIKYAAFTKQEGDSSAVLKFNFKNISSQSFLNNLVVRYKITNSSKSASFYDTLSIPLAANTSWKTSFRVPTLGWVGNNTLEVFFNPSPGQPEEYLENNQFTMTYTVTADHTNPVLSVAFDGRQIMNGEIVAPNPTVSIAVNDENKYLIRQDASGITVDLQRPCGQTNCPYERVNLTGNEITIYPAGNNNKFELRYKPANLPDGKYNLRVQASDVSGNLSGIKPYTIQFEIVNETSLSNFLPYPNPFSSKMWFVYTLTGEVPDQIRIQILTITGKVVRQIFHDELGPLYIGTHRTDFVWDGTDDFGDPLANGLYLYRVNASKNGEPLKHRDNSTDGMFKDGYGKLYILR
jgi:hypothetical protein